MNHISKLLKESLSEAVIVEMLDEDYPQSFNFDEFRQIKSFRERINYCEEHLKRISSGSSRIVYMVDNDKVLKLAKNTKGLGQNEAEISLGKHGWYEDALAHIYEYDELWVEMELARKISNNDFKRLLGYSLDDFATYLHYIYYGSIVGDKGAASFYELPDEMLELIGESDFASTITQMMSDYDINPSDFGKRSSYGLVNRSGVDKIVLIDYGLTSDVYNTYYS